MPIDSSTLSKMVVHTCKHCAFKSKKKSNLTIHMRKHSGEKPHTCTLCDYASAKGSDLTRHMQTHTAPGERKEKPKNLLCT